MSNMKLKSLSIVLMFIAFMARAMTMIEASEKNPENEIRRNTFKNPIVNYGVDSWVIFWEGSWHIYEFELLLNRV